MVFVARKGIYRGNILRRIFIRGACPTYEVAQEIEELHDAHRLAQVLRDICDAAADRSHSTPLVLLWPGQQGLRKIVHFRAEKQRPVMQQPPAVDTHCRTGYFLAIDRQIVAALDPGLDAECGQRLDYGLRKTAEHRAAVFILALEVYESIIDVAKIVKHSASAGHPPHHGYTAALDEVAVDLGPRILIAPDDNCAVVAPEPEYRLVLCREKVFLGGQVPVRIDAFVADYQHLFSILSLCSAHLKTRTKTAAIASPSNAPAMQSPRKCIPS